MLKKIGIAVIVLAVVSIGLAIWAVDSGRVTRIVMAQFEQAVGRPVTAGNVDWDLFPPQVRLESVQIEETGAFEGDLFAAESIELQMPFQSLIRGEPRLTSVVFVNPTVFVRRGADGTWNLATLAKNGDEGPGAGAGAGAASFSIESWRIENGTVILIEDGAEAARVEDVTAELRDISATSSFPFEITADLDGSGTLAMEGSAGPLRAQGGPMPVEAGIKLEAVPLDLVGSLLRFAGNNALAGADLAGTASGTLDLAFPTNDPLPVTGVIEVQDVHLKMPSWTEPLQIMNADVKVNPGSVELAGLTARTSSGELRGSAAVTGFEPVEFRFDLSGESLDLATFAAGGKSGETRATTRQAPKGSERAVRGRGTLAFDRLSYGSLVLAPFSAEAHIDGGTVSMNPVRFGLYEGAGSGELRVDTQSRPAAVDFSGQVQNVDANKLLSENTSASNRLFGELNGDVKIRFRGDGRAEVLRGVTGGGSLSLHEGRLAALDLPARLAEISPLGVSATEKGTPITRLSATYSVENGSLKTENLAIETPKVNLTAEGSLDLVSGALQLEAVGVFGRDVRLTDNDGPLSLQAAQRALTDEEGRVVLPFDIRGSLTSPKFALDVGRVGRKGLIPEILNLFGSGPGN